METTAPSPKLGLQYANNNSFFPEGIDFLQKIGFVSMLSIDMYVKYSFQKANWSNMIQGAEIDTYDNDHNINDTFFVHKITLPRRSNITRALVYIALNHNKAFTLKEFASLVKSIPMVSLLILGLLSFLIPGVVGKILQGVNLIAFLIFILFFAYKFLRYFFELTKSSSMKLQDHRVVYLNPHDLKIFTRHVKEKINQLQDYWVTDIALDRNALYLKQDLIDTSQTTLLGELFGQKKVFDEARKRATMDQMIDLLSEPEFLALFREENAD